MKGNQAENPRCRDDTSLGRLVGEARARLRAEGLAEQALDWSQVMRQERASWWRERLREALVELGARAGEYAGAAGQALAALARAPETLAAAALEVSLDAVRQLGRVDPAPALACAAAEANMQFAYGSAADRVARGMAAEDEGSIGILLAAGIDGARVIADVRGRRVTVEFLGGAPGLILLLVPQDPDRPVQVHEVTRSSQAVFPDVSTGEYLLSFYRAT